MPINQPPFNRRKWLQRATALTALGSAGVLAQSGRSAAPQGNIVIAQVVDTSQARQDVSKDFLIGSRAAWQDLNLRGGIRGRKVQHLVVETDGTPASLRAALDTIKANTSCIVMFGSVGDQIAGHIVELVQDTIPIMAHVAPWLQNSSLEVGETSFPIFAARQEQISHALKTLSVMGVGNLGVVYGINQDYSEYHLEVERIATGMQLKLQPFQGNGELRVLGQKLTPGTPAVLLFVGGTPELAEFTKGLEKQARQRYIVALADVNLQTMLQMGAARNIPIIATQPVPLVTASLPIVRSYREALLRLFDEPPTSLGLAGFIAGRYTHEVLKGIEGHLTRQSAMIAFQQRTNMDIGGFRISFDLRRRSSAYVTQSMMTLDGRLIG